MADNARGSSALRKLKVWIPACPGMTLRGDVSVGCANRFGLRTIGIGLRCSLPLAQVRKHGLHTLRTAPVWLIIPAQAGIQDGNRLFVAGEGIAPTLDSSFRWNDEPIVGRVSEA